MTMRRVLNSVSSSAKDTGAKEEAMTLQHEDRSETLSLSVEEPNRAEWDGAVSPSSVAARPRRCSAGCLPTVRPSVSRCGTTARSDQRTGPGL